MNPAADTSGSDKIVGILLIVLSLCGVCAGAAIMGVGSLAGIASAGGGFLPGAAIGGVAIAIGVVILAVSAINVAAGVGVFKSARWGFLLAAVLCGISVLLALVDLSGLNLITLLLNVGIVVYCVMRLTGRLGSQPL